MLEQVSPDCLDPADNASNHWKPSCGRSGGALLAVCDASLAHHHACLRLLQRGSPSRTDRRMTQRRLIAFAQSRRANLPESLGCRRAHSGVRGIRADELWLARHDFAAQRPRNGGSFAGLLPTAVLRTAHDLAHVRSHRRLADLHLYLCDPRRQEPARRNGAYSTAGRLAVGPDPWLSFVYGHVFSGAFSRFDPWRRMRRDLRHFHQPGLEHGLFLLPVAKKRAARS